jgi:hypothetical protein
VTWGALSEKLTLDCQVHSLVDAALLHLWFLQLGLGLPKEQHT